MTSEFINKLFDESRFSGSEKFRDMLYSNSFIKRYSKRKEDSTFSDRYVGVFENICFFFYNGGYRYGSFLCSIVSDSANPHLAHIEVKDMNCEDINRADCWEWIEYTPL